MLPVASANSSICISLASSHGLRGNFRFLRYGNFGIAAWAVERQALRHSQQWPNPFSAEGAVEEDIAFRPRFLLAARSTNLHYPLYSTNDVGYLGTGALSGRDWKHRQRFYLRSFFLTIFRYHRAHLQAVEARLRNHLPIAWRELRDPHPNPQA